MDTDNTDLTDKYPKDKLDYTYLTGGYAGVNYGGVKGGLQRD
jgi:hypothetical protein